MEKQTSLENSLCVCVGTHTYKAHNDHLWHATFSACTPEWIEELNKHGLNGQYQSSIRTLVNCQAQCLITANCIAIDYKPMISQCYLFTSPYNSAPITGINHYKLIRCGMLIYINLPLLYTPKSYIYIYIYISTYIIYN